MEKMTKDELTRWVVSNHEETATLDDDWDACYSAFAESGELADGHENWKNPFADSTIVVKVCDIKGRWHTVAQFEHQAIYKPCESREMILGLMDILGVDNVGFDIEG